MADTFFGQTMHVQSGALSRDQGADISIRHIPGANVSYVDNAGMRARVLTLDLFFAAAADYVSMEGVVGNAGTLVYVDYPGGIRAVLISLKRTGRGLSTTGETFASADFVLLA